MFFIFIFEHLVVYNEALFYQSKFILKGIMDINFSKEDIAFRDEIREWLANDYPKM